LRERCEKGETNPKIALLFHKAWNSKGQLILQRGLQLLFLTTTAVISIYHRSFGFNRGGISLMGIWLRLL